MKKISGNLIVGLLFVFVMASLLVFGGRLASLTGYAVSDGNSENSNEKIGIGIENNYAETGDIDFVITLYDESKNKIDGQINYLIRNYYSEVIEEGVIESGESRNFKLPENPGPGPWELSANFDSIKAKELFNLGEYSKLDIKLEGDNLIVKNIGNRDYDGNILIYIGDSDQTASMYLAIGQTKRIRLTAPNGEYDVRVDTGEEDLVFSGISLTGNVIGLERVFNDNFWKKYPMIGVFIGVMVLISVVVGVLKFRKK